MILLPLVLSPVASRGAGAAAVPFAPNDLAGLFEWFDPNEGVASFAGNNFTDETRSIQLSGFPSSGEVNPNNVEIPKNTNQINGKNAYSQNLSGGEFGGQVAVNWSGSAWGVTVIENFEEGFSETIYTATGNTAYPWQATWANGTVTPTATTADVPASVNDTVAAWRNRVSGGQDAIQTTGNRQPTFKEDSRGKYLEFTFANDVLSINKRVNNINPPLTYYGVCSFADGATSYLIVRSNLPNTRNALYQRSLDENLTLRASTEVASTLSVNPGVERNVFVVCGVLNGGGTGLVGRGSISNSVNVAYAEQSLTGLGTSSTTQSVYHLGAGSSTGSNAIERIYEFIAYNQAHSEADRLKVINYLQAKYGT